MKKYVQTTKDMLSDPRSYFMVLVGYGFGGFVAYFEPIKTLILPIVFILLGLFFYVATMKPKSS